MTMLRYQDKKLPTRVRSKIIRFRGIGMAYELLIRLTDREIDQAVKQIADGYGRAIKETRDRYLRELAQGVNVDVGA